MPTVIDGVVTDDAGRPVGEARVYFTSGPVPLPDVAALTAADGSFQLTAPQPGRYALQCTSPDGATTSYQVEVSPDTPSRIGVSMHVPRQPEM